MGAPAKPFDLFFKFIQQDPIVLQALEQFSLFAFLFYDLERDFRFHQHLQTHFDELDEKTGLNLLFIAPIQDKSSKKYSETSRCVFWDILNEHYPEIFTFGEDRSNFNIPLNRAILEHLNLDRNTPPTILLCCKPEDRGYITLGTSEQSVNQQLCQLKDVADFLATQQELSNNILLQSLMAEQIQITSFNTWKVWEDTSLKENLTPVVLSHDKNRAYEFHSYLRNFTERTRDVIRHLSYKYNDEEDMELFEQLNEAIFPILDLVASRPITDDQQKEQNRKKHRHRQQILPEQQVSVFEREGRIYELHRKLTIFDVNWFLEHRLTHWDEEARSMCKSALYAMIHFQQLSKEMWGISDSEFGVSLVVGGLSAAFEREMNSSLAHFLRQSQQIELPKYYWKYDEASGRKYVDDQIGTINVNKKRKRWSGEEDWEAITLGRLRVHMEIQQKEEIPNCSGSMLHLWQDIKDLRNRATHGARLNWDDVDTMLNYFKLWCEIPESQKIAYLSWLAFKRNFPTKQNYVLEQRVQEEHAKHSTDINELLEIIQSGNVKLIHSIFCRNFDTQDTLMTLCDAFEQKVPIQVQRDVLNKNMDSPLHQSVVAEFWKRDLHRDIVITFSDLPPEIISDILNTTNREDIFMVLSQKTCTQTHWFTVLDLYRNTKTSDYDWIFVHKLMLAPIFKSTIRHDFCEHESFGDFGLFEQLLFQLAKYQIPRTYDSDVQSFVCFAFSNSKIINQFIPTEEAYQHVKNTLQMEFGKQGVYKWNASIIPAIPLEHAVLPMLIRSDVGLLDIFVRGNRGEITLWMYQKLEEHGKLSSIPRNSKYSDEVYAYRWNKADVQEREHMLKNEKIPLHIVFTHFTDASVSDILHKIDSVFADQHLHLLKNFNQPTIQKLYLLLKHNVTSIKGNLPYYSEADFEADFERKQRWCIPVFLEHNPSLLSSFLQRGEDNKKQINLHLSSCSEEVLLKSLATIAPLCTSVKKIYLPDISNNPLWQTIQFPTVKKLNWKTKFIHPNVLHMFPSVQVLEIHGATKIELGEQWESIEYLNIVRSDNLEHIDLKSFPNLKLLHVNKTARLKTMTNWKHLKSIQKVFVNTPHIDDLEFLQKFPTLSFYKCNKISWKRPEESKSS